MITSFFRFLVELAVLSVILLPMNYYVTEALLSLDFDILYYGVYLYYLLLVIGIQVAIIRALRDRPQKFIIVFMSSMGLKIFISLILLVTVMMSGLNNSKAFAINFLILYLVFSGFSIYQMQRAQKEISPQEKK